MCHSLGATLEVMGKGGFAATAAAARPRQIALGVLGVLGALAAGWIAVAVAAPLIGGLDRLEVQATDAYRKGEWAALIASATWACLFGTVSTWLLAHSLRRALGLPRRGITAARRRWLVVAWVFSVVVLIRLLVWSLIGGHALRFQPGATSQALAMGGAIWALFGYDTPRLVRNARDALAARLPVMARAAHPLDRLREGMRARVAGTVREAGRSVGAGRDGRALVCRRVPATGDRPERVDAVSFFLEAGGARAWVDVDPARALFAIEDERGCIADGDRVDVVGTVDADLAGHRAGPHHVTAGAGRLYVLAGSPSFNRRLLLAAIIELLAAAGLSLTGLAFLGYAAVAWLWIP